MSNIKLADWLRIGKISKNPPIQHLETIPTPFYPDLSRQPSLTKLPTQQTPLPAPQKPADNRALRPQHSPIRHKHKYLYQYIDKSVGSVVAHSDAVTSLCARENNKK